MNRSLWQRYVAQRHGLDRLGKNRLLRKEGEEF